MRPVRAPVIILLLSGLPLLTVTAPAEVIHLKNGRTIWADHARENGGHVEYDIGDNNYAIPKSSVERIEAGGIAPPYASAGTNATDIDDLPALAPVHNFANNLVLISKIIHDGRVDPDALFALDQQGDSEISASGYLIAGKHEFESGNFSKARTYLQAALRFDSQNPTILNYYAATLIRSGNASEALPYAERAVRLAPDSPDTLTVLGYAQFASDHSRDAIRAWKRSLSLRPDPVVEKLLAKAERETRAEADFSERESSHFTLRYEGKQTSEQLRQNIVATLETEYDDLVRELGASPRSTIPVVLYTGRAFFDVTQAPAWSTAVNDGKLRIPIEGMTSVTPEMARVLKHELAHSFITQISNGRCPQWLQEGIAQAVEPKSLSAHGPVLARMFATEREIPFNALEGSFMQFSTIQAVIAYDESLAAVQYINDTYGMSDIQRVLERLAQGSSTEAALRAVVHSDYAQLQSEVGRYLVGKYGE
jgi:tetratricopeptide (TPR) repeat protein